VTARRLRLIGGLMASLTQALAESHLVQRLADAADPPACLAPMSAYEPPFLFFIAESL